MEYDWLVAPGADPSRIALAIGGVQRLRMTSDGSVVFQTAAGDVRQAAPVLSQTIEGRRRPVAGRYVLLGHDELGLRVATYDRAKPLTIDPTIRYKAVLSGSLDDWVNAVTVDSAGNTYVTGGTQSANFPTRDPMQPTFGGDSDAFITKIKPRTGKLAYSSHIGGTAYDGASGVAVDARGDAYISGWVGSYNFPVLHPVQKKTGGGEDAFVIELTAAGNKAYFSTYLGGEHDDEATTVALGPNGNVDVGGETDSPHFPNSVKYGSVPRGNDGFVVELHAGTTKPARLPCELLFGDPKTGCLKPTGHPGAVISAAGAEGRNLSPAP